MSSLSGSTAAGPATSARTGGAAVWLCQHSTDLDSRDIQDVVRDFLGENVEVTEETGQNEKKYCIVRISRHLDAEEQSRLQTLCGLKASAIRLLREPGPLLAKPVLDPNETVRPDTIRVQRVPLNWSRPELEEELRHLFTANANVHSLVRNFDKSLTATVTFPTLVNKWLKELVHDSNISKKELRGKHNLNYDTNFMNITPLYEHEEPLVDIIAVEGLGTNAFGTFRAPQGDEMWLRDYLKEPIPRSRVLLYGYDSSVIDNHTERSGLSSQTIFHIAKNCRGSIDYFRDLTSTDKDRPIIWIGQSMGGLVIQEALAMKGEPNLIKVSVGLLGYGIPIHGLKNEALREAVRGQPNRELIQDICIGEDNKPSDYLRDLADRFRRFSNNLKLVYFYETNPTGNRLDPEASPVLMVQGHEPSGEEEVYYLPYNHSELVKFSNRADSAYITTYQVLLRMVQLIEGFRGSSRGSNVLKGSQEGLAEDFKKDVKNIVYRDAYRDQ